MLMKSLFGKDKPTSVGRKSKTKPPKLLRGQFTVAAISHVNMEISLQGFWMTGVLSGPGVRPTAVLYEAHAPSDRWPDVGQTLPVAMEHSIPKVIEVLWSDVPERKVLGLQRAHDMLAAMNLA